MKLHEQELLILNSLHDGKENDLHKTFEPKLDKTDINAVQRELVYYIENLKRYGLVDIDVVYDKKTCQPTKYYSVGGQMSQIYKNAACFGPFWERIHINKAGMDFVEEYRLTKCQKLKRYCKRILAKVGEKLTDELISSLALVIVGFIIAKIPELYNWGLRLIKELADKI